MQTSTFSPTGSRRQHTFVRWATRVAAGATAALLAGAVPAAAAAAPATPPVRQARAASCSGVWVVVDFGTLGGGIQSKCAAAGSHSTGAAALRATFTIDFRGGLLYRINGKPSDGGFRTDHYWSYWQAKKNADGSYSSWSYSNLGAGQYKPQQGDAEGWRFLSTNDMIPPQSAPPRDTPPPPTRTTSRPTSGQSTRTTAAQTRTTTTRTTTTRTTGTQTRQPQTSTTTSAPNSPSGTQSVPATQPPSVQPTTTPPTSSPPATVPNSDSVPTGTDPTEHAGETVNTDPPQQDDQSGLIATLGTLAVLVLGGGGLGAWWFLRRR